MLSYDEFVSQLKLPKTELTRLIYDLYNEASREEKEEKDDRINSCTFQK